MGGARGRRVTGGRALSRCLSFLSRDAYLELLLSLLRSREVVGSLVAVGFSQFLSSLTFPKFTPLGCIFTFCFIFWVVLWFFWSVLLGLIFKSDLSNAKLTCWTR